VQVVIIIVIFFHEREKQVAVVPTTTTLDLCTDGNDSQNHFFTVNCDFILIRLFMGSQLQGTHLFIAHLRHQFQFHFGGIVLPQPRGYVLQTESIQSTNHLIFSAALFFHAKCIGNG